MLVVGAGAALAAWVGVSFLRDFLHGVPPDAMGFGGLPRGSHAGGPPADYFGLRPAVGDDAYQGRQGDDDGRPGGMSPRLRIPSGFGNVRGSGGGDGSADPGDGNLTVDGQRPDRRWRDCALNRGGRPSRCGPWNYGPAPGDPVREDLKWRR